MVISVETKSRSMVPGDEKSRGRWMPEEKSTESRSGWEVRILVSSQKCGRSGGWRMGYDWMKDGIPSRSVMSNCRIETLSALCFCNRVSRRSFLRPTAMT